MAHLEIYGGILYLIKFMVEYCTLLIQTEKTAVITQANYCFFFRIQQIQLLGRDMRGAEHDQLWNQIEAEIHLHRHKTVIRACRGRRDPNNKTPAPPPPSQPESASNDEEDAESKARKRRGIGEPRTVVIHKDKSEGLGISITVRGYSLNHQLF